MKPTVYGEVLTTNEVIQRLEGQEREKAELAAKKADNAKERQLKRPINWQREKQTEPREWLKRN